MTETTAITVIPFGTPTLGDRSYLARRTGVAIDDTFGNARQAGPPVAVPDAA